MADLVLEDVAASSDFKEQIRLKLGRMLAIAVDGPGLPPAEASGASVDARGMASSASPVRGGVVTLTRAVDLWDSAPNGQRPGRMTGRVAKGSRVVIDDIRSIPLQGAADAVWARIKVRGESPLARRAGQLRVPSRWGCR
ncbi:hypothetical protein [Vulcanococcus limneticus]|uniref:hypothetical protein n=1 Tax=Vulcanococcus limneticus TaxID=2170428 RepID=UPI00398C0263